MTKARDIADFKFEDIVDTGTEGTKVATGTTAQRGSTQGQFRFNTTTGLAEYYTGTEFKPIDSPPTIASIDNTNIESSTLPANIVITGNSFSNTSVKFIGNDGTEINSPSVTTNSASQVTAQVPTTVTSANEPFDVKVTNSSGLSATLEDAFNVDASPVFGVASGSLGTLANANRAASNLTTITATDDEGDTVTFSVTTGSLPTGITLNSNGTFSGTANQESSDTTYTFTVTASDGTNTSTRQYTITVNAPIATGGTVTNVGGYTYHTFTSSGNFVVLQPKSVEYLLVAGGGGGGAGNIGSAWAGGGGGAGGVIDSTFSTSAQTYAIVIGNGGAGDTAGSSGNGANGQNSTAFGQTATGGGGGGTRNGNEDGANGGSGGGASGANPPDAVGGTGTSGQGNDGGDGSYGGAGGGGYGSAGVDTNDANANGSNGGSGINWKSLGTSYAGGGGGGAGDPTSNQGGNGTFGTGQAGGGNGGHANGSTNSDGADATDNTGSGGGGAGGGAINANVARNGGDGGDGIFIVRYQ